MEDKLKERLTGAAILVAVLVLVVPELFRGTAPKPAATPVNAPTPTPDNAAPLNTYQIDLQPAASAPAAGAAGAAGTAPVADAPASSAPANSVPVDAAPAGVAIGSSGAAASEVTAAPAANTSPAAGTAPVELAPASTATSAAVTKAATKVAAPPRIAATKAATPASTTSSGNAAHGWVVRLGVFSKRDNAQKLQKQLQDKGVTVAVTGPDGRGLYSVHSLRVADRNAATDWQKRAKSLGFAGVLTEAP